MVQRVVACLCYIISMVWLHLSDVHATLLHGQLAVLLFNAFCYAASALSSSESLLRCSDVHKSDWRTTEALIVLLCTTPASVVTWD
jgi:hypothetical protein